MEIYLVFLFGKQKKMWMVKKIDWFLKWTSELISLLSWWLSGEEAACNAGDLNLIPGLGRFPGEGNGSPFQYSCLGYPRIEKPGGLVHRVTKE